MRRDLTTACGDLKSQARNSTVNSLQCLPNVVENTKSPGPRIASRVMMEIRRGRAGAAAHRNSRLACIRTRDERFSSVDENFSTDLHIESHYIACTMKATWVGPMRRKSFGEMQCPIARSLERVGEWWSMLILRDASLGLTRFDQFQQSLGIAPNMLTRRLNSLVEAGPARTPPLQ